jgi:hypothetical protein
MDKKLTLAQIVAVYGAAEQRNQVTGAVINPAKGLFAVMALPHLAPKLRYRLAKMTRQLEPHAMDYQNAVDRARLDATELVLDKDGRPTGERRFTTNFERQMALKKELKDVDDTEVTISSFEEIVWPDIADPSDPDKKRRIAPEAEAMLATMDAIDYSKVE